MDDWTFDAVLCESESHLDVWIYGIEVIKVILYIGKVSAVSQLLCSFSSKVYFMKVYM